MVEQKIGDNVDSVIVGGKYRHFKGGEYTVIGVARHSETQEKLVVYKSPYEHDGGNDDNGHWPLWVRQISMFCGEKVFGDGRQVKRFEFIS
jgi:hypothetical protein